MRSCPTCGQKIKIQLCSYSSGDGCLTMVWREKTPQMASTGRKVTKQDCLRFLVKEESKSDWLPSKINGRWCLARFVKRTGKNRLNVGGTSYTYELDTSFFDGRAEEGNLVVHFEARMAGKYQTRTCLNGSIRMVIRFFLNHESELVGQWEK